MKTIILTVIGLILILLTSYIAISYESNSFLLKKFVIEGDRENIETSYGNLKTFAIGQKPTGGIMLLETYKQTQVARQRNLLYQQRDEEIQKCIDKITKNWKRTYVKRSYGKEYDDDEEKWVYTEGSPFYEREREFYGHDPDEDWHLYWRLRNRALNGEKIC